jgi:hypothetical protein
MYEQFLLKKNQESSQIDSFIDLITSKNRVTVPPKRPSDFEGRNFTMSQIVMTGGYGKPTRGQFVPETGEPTGFKPYGALGFGLYNNKSYSFDQDNKSRVMLVTLVPNSNYAQGNDLITMEVGRYTFNSDINIGIPFPASTFEYTNSAKQQAAHIFGTLVALFLISR